MLRALLTIVGVLELLFPRQLVEVGTKMAYESPEEFEIKPWVIPAVRTEGLIFLFFVLRGVVQDKWPTEVEAEIEA
ncbi:hypothetical protein [Halorussus halophilus]|uniref:hypothetical protein n=1 Tax=Halorussus halophilus TaxID=2650975 RepID=UPI0013013295|nr:hypothetical protein [Halorussus halophilus]